MGYIPVADSPRTCAHCGTVFYAKDKRRIYCTSSCNTLAWMSRRDKEKIVSEEQETGSSNLTFSVKDVGNAAVGSGIAAAANYLFNDAPFYKALEDRFNRIEYFLGRQAGRNDVQHQKLDDLITALGRAIPELNGYLHLLENNRRKRLK